MTLIDPLLTDPQWMHDGEEAADDADDEVVVPDEGEAVEWPHAATRHQRDGSAVLEVVLVIVLGTYTLLALGFFAFVVGVSNDLSAQWGGTGMDGGDQLVLAGALLLPWLVLLATTITVHVGRHRGARRTD